MRRLSALDHMVQNFQHSWETNPQFRALWSGGLGLGIVVMLCACLGFAFTFARTAAASFSSGGSTNPIVAPPSGTPRAGSVDSNITFPTQTVPPWGPQQVPAGNPIAPSLTPAPTPTALPTPTPLPTTPAGPGGGGGGGGGSPAGTVSITSTTPSPLKQGAAGSVVIHTSSPNVQFIVNVTWQTGGFFPMTNGGGGYTTDGSGDYNLGFNVPSGGCTNGSNSTIKFWVIASFPGGTVQPTLTEQCTQ
jgi:hypothetical protein